MSIFGAPAAKIIIITMCMRRLSDLIGFDFARILLLFIAIMLLHIDNFCHGDSNVVIVLNNLIFYKYSLGVRLLRWLNYTLNCPRKWTKPNRI